MDLKPHRLRAADAFDARLATDLEEGGRFASEVLAPLNSVGDKHGCVWNQDGSVTTIGHWPAQRSTQASASVAR